MFTPELSKFYQNTKAAGKPFEIVFISSDSDENAFDGYYGEHPWVALPYAERDKKAQLSAKYKVRGIPTLVLLDESGATITQDGRHVAMSGDIEAFPWKPKTFIELLTGSLVSHAGPVAPESLKGKRLGLYFSAHWCPPCRQFTPILKEAHQKAAAENKPFEVIYISADNSEEEYNDYYQTHPWLAVKYPDEKTREALQQLYEIEGFPTLVLTDDSGKPYNANGRMAVTQDPTGFPWVPPAVSVLPNGVENINDTPSALLLLDGCPPGAQADLEAAYKSLAEQTIAKWTAAGTEPPHKFLLARQADEITAQIRNLVKSPASPNPEFLILAIPEGGKFYKLAEAPTAPTIDAFLSAWLAGSLQPQQMQK
jgi:nucleoredoxin